MKIIKYIALITTFLFVAISCEDEPLEGEYYNDDGDLIEDASFIAELEDFTFVGSPAGAETLDGITTITGNRFNGDLIVLTLHGSGTGTFDMVSQGEATFGINVEPIAFSTNTDGGSGQVDISLYDADAGLISGTFSFIARRAILDGDGNPVLDGNGNPTFDSVTITDGKFVNIPLVSDGSTYEEIPEPKILKTYSVLGADNSVTNYFYNEAGDLERVHYQDEMETIERLIFYNGTSLDSVAFHFNGNYTGIHERYYSNAGNVTSKIRYIDDTLAVERMEFYYNENKLGQIRVFENDTIEDHFMRYHLSYDGFGNVSSFKKDITENNENDVIYEYTYDTNNHYYRTTNPFILFVLETPSVRSNPLSKEEYPFPFSGYINRWTYEIEYDDDDYPILITELLNGAQHNTIVIEYEE